jgi:hypothetical protein
MFRVHRAHHQERQIVQYNLWELSLCVGGRVVCRSYIVLIIRRDKLCQYNLW